MMAALTRHFKNIWTEISKAGEAYNDSVDSVVSYDQSVRLQGERLLKIGSGAGGRSSPKLRYWILKSGRFRIVILNKITDITR